MDKAVMGLAQKVMEKGEKQAPVKSLKVKVKFQKAKGESGYDDKKKDLAKKMK